MASAWGNAWGKAWGNAWGVIASARGKGGSRRRLRLRGEFDDHEEYKPSEKVTVEDVRQVLAKLRPEPVSPSTPDTPTANAAPVATLFERKSEKAPEPAPAATAPVALTPGTKDALGMKPVERTYDLEMLLLLAA
jgi:hypothetical protein